MLSLRNDIGDYIIRHHMMLLMDTAEVDMKNNQTMCRGVSQLVKLISSSNRVDDPRAPVTYPKLVRLYYLVFQQKTSHGDKLLIDTIRRAVCLLFHRRILQKLRKTKRMINNFETPAEKKRSQIL